MDTEQIIYCTHHCFTLLSRIKMILNNLSTKKEITLLCTSLFKHLTRRIYFQAFAKMKAIIHKYCHCDGSQRDNFVIRLHVIISDPGSSETEENESEGEEDRSDEDWSPDSPLSTREQPSVIVSRIRGTDKKEFTLYSDIWIRIS